MKVVSEKRPLHHLLASLDQADRFGTGYVHENIRCKSENAYGQVKSKHMFILATLAVHQAFQHTSSSSGWVVSGHHA